MKDLYQALADVKKHEQKIKSVESKKALIELQKKVVLKNGQSIYSSRPNTDWAWKSLKQAGKCLFM